MTPAAVNEQLAIVFEDDHCLAVAKPPGQFTQGTWAPAGEVTLETAVRAYLDPADPRSAYLGIIHRLDRPCSGVLLWAKTLKAARRLSAQFERRTVIKEYWAIVELPAGAAGSAVDAGSNRDAGAPAEAAVWSDWLTRPNESGVVCAVAPASAGAREAVTRWQRAAAPALPPGCAWLRLWPETGRTHQLRIQSARRGMPIVGDSAYGSTLNFPSPHGIALHARSLRFRHPMTGIDLSLEAPVPSSWTAAGINVSA
jgi:23S rRNA pseudouridine1911/1915/1917 synthase